MLLSCPLGTPRIFLSVSPSFWEAQTAAVPKMCFHPMLKKEASIFTAESAFLLAWCSWDRSFDGSLHKMDFPCQVSCQALSPERCKTAEVEVGGYTELVLCVCKISWHIRLGAQSMRWLQIKPGAEGGQVCGPGGGWEPGVRDEPAGRRARVWG